MLYQLRHLSDKERQTIKDAPIWVSLFIASANGHIDNKELKRIKDVIHVKSYSLKNDVHLLYEELDDASKIDALISEVIGSLPEDPEERVQNLYDRISQLNPILPKLDNTYARQYYKSLREIGVSVANASGGVLGVGKVGEEEHNLLELRMINRP